MSDALSIWLDGLRVAVIERARPQRLRLTYTEEAIERYAFGTPLLSLRLPVVTEAYAHGAVSAFLDGLLPEEETRRTVAADLNVRASDTYALIEALGRDSAGALVILPSGEPLPTVMPPQRIVPLTDTQFHDLVANLRSAPLGIRAGARLSLAGVQEKLVLTRTPDGGWALPNAGTPSTHILKPQIPGYPQTVENEALCMRLAKHLGLPVANVETTTVNGQKLIVVERYDRKIDPDGGVRRVHQEDFCQALGLRPDRKYEEAGGPSLRRIARILAEADGTSSLDTLLRAVTLNTVIGNGDAHGKNFSLVHGGPGVVRLAPLYDLLSTQVYGERRLAMYIDGVQIMDRVTGARIANEAVSWGVARTRAVEVISDVLDRAAAAVDVAAAETEDAPGELHESMRRRAANLQESSGAGNG